MKAHLHTELPGYINQLRNEIIAADFDFEAVAKNHGSKAKISEDGLKVTFKYFTGTEGMHEDPIKRYLARGFTLHSETLDVLSFPFVKFFNYWEELADEIDWQSADVFRKYDGSLIHMYFDFDHWQFGTSGTPDGQVPLSFNAGGEKTFSDLAMETLNHVSEKAYLDILYNKGEIFVPGNTFIFELCTPENEIVSPTFDYNLYILGARNLKTFQEFDNQDLEDLSRLSGIPYAERFDFSDSEAIIANLEDLPWEQEGYVVRDKNFNRVKMKNPAYIQKHMLQSNLKDWKFVQFIQDKTLDDFLGLRPEFASIADLILDIYDELKSEFVNQWETVLQSEEWKEFQANEGSRNFRKPVALMVRELTKNYQPFTTKFFKMVNNPELDPVEMFEEINPEKIFALIRERMSLNARLELDHLIRINKFT